MPAGAAVSMLVTSAAVGGGAVVAWLCLHVAGRAAGPLSGWLRMSSSGRHVWCACVSPASGRILLAHVSRAEADGETWFRAVGGACMRA